MKLNLFEGKSIREIEGGEILSPHHGDLKYINRNINSLYGSPDHVTGNFDCSTNPSLTSLMHAPRKVEGSFRCAGSGLTSLDYLPAHIGGGIWIRENENLTSLKGLPEEINGDLSASSCNLTSLKGISSIILGNCYLSHNRLTSLEGIHKYIKKIRGICYLQQNPIKSHVLGLLKIDGLDEVHLTNIKVQTIINKHLLNGRDIFACQEELIDAGLEEYAQL